MTPSTYPKLIRFLQEDLAIAPSMIDFALKKRDGDFDPLPMIMWRYGLITLQQLDLIYDWLESAA